MTANKKLEREKLYYDLTKTLLVTNLGVVMTLAIGYWSLPDTIKPTILMTMTVFASTFIIIGIAFVVSFARLSKWYK